MAETRSPIGRTPAAGRLKIIHYLPRLRREEGGLFRAVIDLARGAVRLGHHVKMLSWDDRDLNDEWPPSSGWSSVTLRPPFLRHVSAPLGLPALATVARALQHADFVHLHGPWYPSNLQLSALARRMGVPYGVSLHGMLDEWSMRQKAIKKRIYHALFARRFLDRAAWIHCSAQAEYAQSGYWFDPRRTAILPNNVDLTPFASLDGGMRARRELDIGGGARFTVLFVGRLHQKKGLELLIDATASMRTAGLIVRVLVAGTGDDPDYTRSLERRVANLGLQTQVRFLGFISGPTKASLYQCADLVATPSSQENFGYVQVEALACGTPVVTSKTDFSAELQTSGGAEIVERDPKLLAAAILSLFEDGARRRAMSASGRAWALATFGGDAATKRFVSLYRAATH